MCTHTQSLCTGGWGEGDAWSTTLSESSLASNAYSAGDSISNGARYCHLPPKPSTWYLLNGHAKASTAGAAQKTVPEQVRGGLLLSRLVHLASWWGEPSLGSKSFSIIFMVLHIVWIQKMHVYSENVFFGLSPFIFEVSATFPLTVTYELPVLFSSQGCY